MNTFEDAVAAQLADGRPTRIAVPADRTLIPDRWLPIFDAPTASQRADIALALWDSSGDGAAGSGGAGSDPTTWMPRFWDTLRTGTADVIVGLHDDDTPVLLYVVRDAYGDDVVTAVWVGYPVDDAQPAPLPELWAGVPEPIRRFYSSVHASFTAPDERTFGPLNPAEMKTLAAELEMPDGVVGWEDEPASTRLLVLMQTASGLRLCVSPDLPEGLGQVVYQQDDPDPPEELHALIDQIMHVRFEVQ